MLEISRNGGDICCSSLKKIQSPTLILYGCKDVFVDKEQTEYLVENIKNSMLYVFPEGKHRLHLQFSEEFNAVITNFLLN
ncbi:valacyclovir hydrolase-like [Coccinella septempunctata]|uniref:valacyclovir hydrolase-like n=1 Tax=Coccinella septempunctata TaxID=41139 RepID=UPI001D071E0F|nr:valacyclovir hydrolase-like [Coccinella septempunctata]